MLYSYIYSKNGAEPCNWTKKMTSSMDKAYAHAYMKIFKTFIIKTVPECRFYMGNLPIEMEVSVRRLNFLSNLLYCNTVDINQILNMKIELLSIAIKFKFDINDNTHSWKNQMWHYLKKIVTCV